MAKRNPFARFAGGVGRIYDRGAKTRAMSPLGGISRCGGVCRMGLFRFVGQLLRFCGETVVNWIKYGLFVTSLPKLLEFVPVKNANAAQNWISANVGPRATFGLFILGMFIAAFLAWRRLDAELVRRIDAQTLSKLTALLAQSDELFDRVVTTEQEFSGWTADLQGWHANTNGMIKTTISAAAALLFDRLSASRPTLTYYQPHSYTTEHNAMRNTLANYQDNLREIIKSHS